MSSVVADETAIASAIFAVDEALPVHSAAGARLAVRCARKLGLDEGCDDSLGELGDALAAYKQFMVLKAVSKDFDARKLSPPPLVDEIWHEHILDTRGYRAFCDAAFKQFVDHDPDGVLDCGARRVRRAATFHYLKLCFKDEYNMEIWNYPLENSCKRKYAAVKDEPEPQPSTSSGNSLNIRICDQTGEVTFYKVKYTTKFDKIFNKYATCKGVCVMSLRFLFDGSRMRGDDMVGEIRNFDGTPPDSMEDGDQLDCMLEQQGGL